MFVRFLETINKRNSNTSVNYRGFSIEDIVICVLWLTWTSQLTILFKLASMVTEM